MSHKHINPKFKNITGMSTPGMVRKLGFLFATQGGLCARCGEPELIEWMIVVSRDYEWVIPAELVCFDCLGHIQSERKRNNRL